MACERPIILSAEGEARELLEKAGAGISVEPENPIQMAEAIVKLQGNPDLCREYGLIGGNFVVKHYSRREKAIKLEKILSSPMSFRESNWRFSNSRPGLDRSLK